MKPLIYLGLFSILFFSCAGSGGHGSVDYLAEGMGAEEAHINYRVEKELGGETKETIELEIINLDSTAKSYPQWVQFSHAAILYYQNGGDSSSKDVQLIKVTIVERTGGSMITSNRSNSFIYNKQQLHVADSVFRHCAEMIDPVNDSSGFFGHRADFDSLIGNSVLKSFDSTCAVLREKNGPVTKKSLLASRTGVLEDGTEVFEIVLIASREKGADRFVFTYSLENGLIISCNMNLELDD